MSERRRDAESEIWWLWQAYRRENKLTLPTEHNALMFHADLEKNRRDLVAAFPEDNPSTITLALINERMHPEKLLP
jgi:hypothetical protein